MAEDFCGLEDRLFDICFTSAGCKSNALVGVLFVTNEVMRRIVREEQHPCRTSIKGNQHALFRQRLK
jgi:hypothetical protein